MQKTCRENGVQREPRGPRGRGKLLGGRQSRVRATHRPSRCAGPWGSQTGRPLCPDPEPPPPTVSEVRTHSRGQEPVTTRNRLCHGVWFAGQGTPGHAFGLRGSFRLGAQGRGHHAWPFFWEAAQNNKGRAVRGREGCGSDGRRRHGEAEGSRARPRHPQQRAGSQPGLGELGAHARRGGGSGSTERVSGGHWPINQVKEVEKPGRPRSGPCRLGPPCPRRLPAPRRRAGRLPFTAGAVCLLSLQPKPPTISQSAPPTRQGLDGGGRPQIRAMRSTSGCGGSLPRCPHEAGGSASSVAGGR